MIVLVLLSTFRYETGTDWSAYYNIFCTQNFIVTNDVAFELLVRVLRYFTDSFVLYQLVTSLLVFGLLYYLLKQKPLYNGLVLYFFSVNVFFLYPTRQYIASILLLLFFVLGRTNNKNSLVLLAMSWHWSSVVALPFLKNKSLLILIFGSVLTIGAIIFKDKILFYMHSYAHLDGIKFKTFSTGDLVRILIVFTYLFLRLLPRDILFLAYFVGTGLSLVLLGMPDAFSRVLFPFFILEAFILDRILRHIVHKTGVKIIVYMGIIGLSYLRLNVSINNYYSEYGEYKWTVYCPCTQ